MSNKVDFSYYKPVNPKQTDFHKSIAINKLLIGSYRGGKTYPAMHEAAFICNDNPGHEFVIFRNTEKALKSNVQKQFVNIASGANAIKKRNGRELYNKSDGDLTWWNDCIVRFRTLSMSWDELKGMNMCGFLIDDPNIARYKKVITQLFTRLTDPHGVKAAYLETIICANDEGHDWLWKTFIKDKEKGGEREEGGDGMFAYWYFETKDNPTLDENYIKIQAAIHSESWMKRYIYGDRTAYAGLIFDEYDTTVHDKDLSWCETDHTLRKILIIDLGITHPTVVLKAATDGTNIYFYGEWYRVNIRTKDLGDYLLSVLSGPENFDTPIIDPKACAREQTSGVSPRTVLKDDFGIRVKLANNTIKIGIEIQKGLMTVRIITDPESGEIKKETHFFIDPIKCPHLAEELETLKWIEQEYSDFDEMAYSEEPQDKDNDCTDCSRYGSVYLKKFMTGLRIQERQNGISNKIVHLNERHNKLKIYQGRPDGVSFERNVLAKTMKNNKMAMMKQMYGGNRRISARG